jgi:hypothetical protein
MAQKLTKGRNTALVAMAAIAPVAATAFLLFKPAPSKSVDKPEDPCPAQEKECRVKASDGCTMEEGKRDITSTKFDWSSCKGFCGDGEIQKGETAKNCPLDVHCGDGVKQLNDTRVIMRYDESAKKVTISTKKIRECAPSDATYCENDCKGSR